MKAIHGRIIGLGGLRRRTNADQPRLLQDQLHFRFDFKALNNDAEYEALIANLDLARELRVEAMRSSEIQC